MSKSTVPAKPSPVTAHITTSELIELNTLFQRPEHTAHARQMAWPLSRLANELGTLDQLLDVIRAAAQCGGSEPLLMALEGRAHALANAVRDSAHSAQPTSEPPASEPPTSERPTSERPSSGKERASSAERGRGRFEPLPEGTLMLAGGSVVQVPEPRAPSEPAQTAKSAECLTPQLEVKPRRFRPEVAAPSFCGCLEALQRKVCEMGAVDPITDDMLAALIDDFSRLFVRLYTRNRALDAECERLHELLGRL